MQRLDGAFFWNAQSRKRFFSLLLLTVVFQFNCCCFQYSPHMPSFKAGHKPLLCISHIKMWTTLCALEYVPFCKVDGLLLPTFSKYKLRSLRFPGRTYTFIWLITPATSLCTLSAVASFHFPRIYRLYQSYTNCEITTGLARGLS